MQVKGLIFVWLSLKGYHKFVNACIYVWACRPLRTTNWEVCFYTVAYTSVSQLLLIKEANLIISDKILAERIKKNTNFVDENLNFSRIKYEKFLLSNNLTASEFEKNFKENEFQEELFNYLGGGIKSPIFFASFSGLK